MGRTTVQTPEEIERNVASFWGLSSHATTLRPADRAKQMIRKAHNLVAVTFPQIGTVFAPSRFIGYANNTFARHDHDRAQRNGGTTDSAISRALQERRPRRHDSLDASFRTFCNRPEVNVQPDKRKRDYWRIREVGRWWRSTNEAGKNGVRKRIDEMPSDADFGRVVLAYDRILRRKTRAEQAILRRRLFNGANTGRCTLCRHEFPLDLLVVAHIKPRSRCTRREQSDYRHNIVAMCKFGCDDLFERGYISAVAGKWIGHPQKLKMATKALRRYVEALAGTPCYKFARSSGYYVWHNEHHLRISTRYGG